MREEGVADDVVEYSRVETNGLVKSTLRPKASKGKDPTTFSVPLKQLVISVSLQ